MTMLMTNATTGYDGSGAAATAAGPIRVTYSGSNASASTPTLKVWSRSDTANYSVDYVTKSFGGFRVNLASGDNYYFTVTGVSSDDSIDLSVVDA